MYSSPQQVFDALPDAFLPERAGSVSLSVQFDLSGDQGGQWGVNIGDGVCETRTGIMDSPIATISTSVEDFVALFNGELNAVAAYMSGHVKVVGDVTGIMNLLSFFEIGNDD